MRTIVMGTLVLAVSSGSGCFLAPSEQLVVGSFDSGRPDDAGTTGDAGTPSDGGLRTDGGFGGGDGGSFNPPASPLACSKGEWCWQHPTPQGQPLNVVYAVSATEAWALGDRGAMLRLQNGVWAAQTPVTDFSFRRVWGSSASDVWAVGYRQRDGVALGNLFRFDGTGWALVPHGGLPTIREVTGSAGGEVWVLTDPNTTLVPTQLLRWNGSALVAAPALPAGLEARSLCVRSQNEVWITVVDQLNSFPIALYRWDGTVWTLIRREPAGSNRRFDSRVVCPADGVALVKVFDFDTGDYSLLEARAGQVTFSAGPGSGSLIATSREVYSVASDGRTVSQWTGTGFQQRFTLADEDSQPVGFDFVGGVGWLANGASTVSAWNGTAFVAPQPRWGSLNVFVAPRPNPNFQDPTAAFGDGWWARRSASGWTFAATPMLSTGEPLRVFGAATLPGGDAWLVGTAIAQYDAAAQTITPVVTPASGVFAAIDLGDDGTTWAVGTQVLRYVAGQWQAPPIAPPTVVDGVTLSNLTFTAVDVRSANDVMLLGNDPAGGSFASIFYRWDGAAWTSQLSTGPTLALFDRDSAGDLYVVEGNEIKKRTPAATTWTTVGSVDGWISRIRVYGPDEIELVVRSEEGIALYGWDIDRRAFSLQGKGLGFSGANDIFHGESTSTGGATYWAPGSGGAVLHFEP